MDLERLAGIDPEVWGEVREGFDRYLLMRK